MTTVLITGADGFVGRNLRLHLAERADVTVRCFTRANSEADFFALLEGVDFVFHLAGVNRPQDPLEFSSGNTGLTEALCDAARQHALRGERAVSIIYSSSIQAAFDNPYGESKLAAEAVLKNYAARTGAVVHTFRLPNVFGKWCRPNYNSAVATFCYNVARDLPIRVNDPSASLSLVYVDDVVSRFIAIMDGAASMRDEEGFDVVSPQYTTTVGDVADLIQLFRTSRDTLRTERVGGGLTRALYSTYVSYLPPESFAYAIPMYGDQRGVFSEMLKTPDCGQFSFFTAHPGVTRGGHYHHSKTEKFLVIKGEARFKFRHMQTGAVHELVTRGDNSEIVETVPGWTHDVTNVGSEELVVMLWANEVFDRSSPDTFSCPL